MINHFENTRGITTKTGLIRTLSKYYSSLEQAINANYTVFEATPTAFIITAGQENNEYASFI